MKITAEKHNEDCFEIKEISGVKSEEALPIGYLEGRPCLYRIPDAFRILHPKRNILPRTLLDVAYTKEQFDTLVQIFKDCADHLKTVRREVKSCWQYFGQISVLVREGRGITILEAAGIPERRECSKNYLMQIPHTYYADGQWILVDPAVYRVMLEEPLVQPPSMYQHVTMNEDNCYSQAAWEEIKRALHECGNRDYGQGQIIEIEV